MDKKFRPHWALQALAEREAPARQIGLWPKIERRALAQPRRSRLDQGNMRLLAGLATLLLAIGLFFSIPAARAAVESIVQKMGLAWVNTGQFGQEGKVTVAEALPAARTPLPSLSVPDIQSRLTFTLLAPAWVPEDLSYVQRSMTEEKTSQTGGQQVRFEYCRTADLDVRQGCLYFSASDGLTSAPPLLAASQEQTILVNGLAGSYAHGGWQEDGRGDPNIKIGSLQWDAQADDAYLTWTQAGVTYLLEAHQLGLKLDDLLQIARSMQAL